MLLKYAEIRVKFPIWRKDHADREAQDVSYRLWKHSKVSVPHTPPSGWDTRMLPTLHNVNNVPHFFGFSPFWPGSLPIAKSRRLYGLRYIMWKPTGKSTVCSGQHFVRYQSLSVQTETETTRKYTDADCWQLVALHSWNLLQNINNYCSAILLIGAQQTYSILW